MPHLRDSSCSTEDAQRNTESKEQNLFRYCVKCDGEGGTSGDNTYLYSNFRQALSVGSAKTEQGERKEALSSEKVSPGLGFL